MTGVTEIIDSEDCLTIYAENAGKLIADIVRALDSLGIRLSSVTFSSPSLDDVFIRHTGRRIRPEALVKASYAGFGRRR
jgi:ABC-2 type transport system ATP-binding protein